MPFDPLEFLTVAQAVASGTPSEGAYRTSVGRAYYSLYLLAANRVGSPTRKEIRHKGSHLATVAKVRARDIRVGSQLDGLRKLRIEADYHLSPSDPRYASWSTNWRDANLIAQNILEPLRKI